MQQMPRFWLIAGALGSLGFLSGLALGNELLMQFTRMLPHLALFAWAWKETRPEDITGAGPQGPFSPRFWLFVGLAACTAADFVIRRPQGFISGIYGFLLAQVAFIVAFSRIKRELAPLTALPFVGYAAILLASIWPSLGDFKGPVVVYGAVIALMGWRAWVTDVKSLRTGALLFMVSDSLLAIEKFGAPTEGAYGFLRYPIILTYWGALALLLKRTG
jgi:uncharacterized membrane protein YhhN